MASRYLDTARSEEAHPAPQIVPTSPDPDQGLAAVAVVDMGDGTVAVHARVALEDAGSLCLRIRDVAAAAARRSA